MDTGLVAEVRRIAVFRPNAVGDFLFALPALTALREAYPATEIVYLGKPWHADFLRGRPGPVDRVEVAPPLPGIGLPTDAVEDAVASAFFERLREEGIDIALQLYGGGRYSNPAVQRLGARLTVGLQAADAPGLDRTLPYHPLQNERLRLLEAVGLVGAATAELAPRLMVTEADHALLRSSGARPNRPYAVLQPGATDPRRRWPPAHFARIGDMLDTRGLAVVVNGTAAEQRVVNEVRSHCDAPLLAVPTELPLGALAALLADAQLLVSNDTGPLHLAAAVGTPTVGIYWLLNLLVSAPLRQANHLHAVALRTRCPVCGEENLVSRCPHDVSFVDEISPAEVSAMAQRLLARPATATVAP